MKNYKLKITVTKEILKRSMMCGVGDTVAIYNCAIALAVRDIFPKACVDGEVIDPIGLEGDAFSREIQLPLVAQDYILDFDRLVHTPEKRLDLPEITFEVEIPDEVIDRIDISKIYEGHPTLQLFESIDN